MYLTRYKGETSFGNISQVYLLVRRNLSQNMTHFILQMAFHYSAAAQASVLPEQMLDMQKADFSTLLMYVNKFLDLFRFEDSSSRKVHLS